MKTRRLKSCWSAEHLRAISKWRLMIANCFDRFKPLAFLQRRNVSCYHGFWWHSTASKTSVPAFDCLVHESAVRSHSWEENKQTQTELPKERFRGAHWKYGRKQGNLCMVCLLQWNVVPPKLREQDLSLPSIWLLRSIDFSLKLKTWAYTVFSLQIRIYVWENLVLHHAHLTYSGRWFSLEISWWALVIQLLDFQ